MLNIADHGILKRLVRMTKLEYDLSEEDAQLVADHFANWMTKGTTYTSVNLAWGKYINHLYDGDMNLHTDDKRKQWLKHLDDIKLQQLADYDADIQLKDLVDDTHTMSYDAATQTYGA